MFSCYHMNGKLSIFEKDFRYAHFLWIFYVPLRTNAFTVGGKDQNQFNLATAGFRDSYREMKEMSRFQQTSQHFVKISPVANISQKSNTYAEYFFLSCYVFK